MGDKGDMNDITGLYHRVIWVISPGDMGDKGDMGDITGLYQRVIWVISPGDING